MAEQQYDVVTIGDTCVDLIVEMGDAVPLFGQVEQWVPDYFLEMGGSTCIFACQAAKLGLRTALLGRVGDDAYGELVLRRLRESGVGTGNVSVGAGLKTGLGVALCRPDGDRAILTYGGSLNAIGPGDVTGEFLALGRHLHYGSYYLLTNLLPEAPRIMARAKRLGMTVSLDTNWDPDGVWDTGLRSCLEYVDVLLPNEVEACAMAGTTCVDEALAVLSALVPTVVVKLGSGGAAWASAGRTARQPVEPVQTVVDTIGAGDSFDAGFLAGWLRGLPLEDCVAIANACGRATTRARGGIMGQLTAAELRPD